MFYKNLLYDVIIYMIDTVRFLEQKRKIIRFFMTEQSEGISSKYINISHITNITYIRS